MSFSRALFQVICVMTLVSGIVIAAPEPSGPLHQRFVVHVPYPVRTVYHHKIRTVPVHHYHHYHHLPPPAPLLLAEPHYLHI